MHQMIKYVYDKEEGSEAGVLIENGHIQPYKHVDLTASLEYAKMHRDAYDPAKAKNMHHIGSVDADVIENVRLLNKWPMGPEGTNLAVKEVVRMIKSGELGAFRVHGA
jgi:hypothetical protein